MNDELTQAKYLVDDYLSKHTEKKLSATSIKALRKAAIIIGRNESKLAEAKKLIEENTITPAAFVKAGICSKSTMYHNKNGNELNIFIHEKGRELNLIYLNEAEYLEQKENLEKELERLREQVKIMKERDAYLISLERELRIKDPDNEVLRCNVSITGINENTRAKIEHAKNNLVSDVISNKITME